MAIVIILIFTQAILSAYLLIMKKEIRSIKRQLQEHLAGKEKPVDVTLINKDIVNLASEINDLIAYQKNKSIEILKQEQQLKEAISNISHDLRTPLTSIIGYLQLLNKTDLLPEQKEYVETILSRSEDLRRLISDFYEISVWEAKETIPNLKRINLDKILVDIILAYAEQFEKKGIVPQFKPLEEPTFVIADEVMLKRVIDNLVLNAITYGKNIFQVTIKKSKDVCIIFENKVSSGYTIDVTRLFDKFYTDDLSRNSSGTGLGLYIVKLLMEKMNGTANATLKDNVLRIVLFVEVTGKRSNEKRM